MNEEIKANGYIADPKKKETSLERQERQRIEYEAKLKSKNQEIEQVLDKNDELAQENVEKDNEILKLRAANKALDKALWREKESKEIGEQQAETLGQRISHKAVEILRKRCHEGRYTGGIKCEWN